MKRYRIKRFTLEQRDEMIRLYTEDGLTPTDIGKMFGTTLQVVRYHLIRADVYKAVHSLGRRTTCSKCGDKLPDRKNHWGAICVQCNRINGLVNKYGMTIKEYSDRINMQRGLCVICKSPFGKNAKAPHVDHNHKTGAVRGILCKNCNIGLGVFFESIGILNSAIEYLENY